MYFQFSAALCRWPAIIYERWWEPPWLVGVHSLQPINQPSLNYSLVFQNSFRIFFQVVDLRTGLFLHEKSVQSPWHHHFLLLCPLWLMLLTCEGFRASLGVCFENTIFIVLSVFEIQNGNLSVLVVFLIFWFDLWQSSSCVLQQSAGVGCVGAPFLTHECICALLWNL